MCVVSQKRVIATWHHVQLLYGPLWQSEFNFVLESVYHFVQVSHNFTHRDCAQDISPTTSVLYRYVLPSGEIMQKLLQLVWSLWEDPIDVRYVDKLFYETSPEMKMTPSIGTH